MQERKKEKKKQLHNQPKNNQKVNSLYTTLIHEVKSFRHSHRRVTYSHGQLVTVKSIFRENSLCGFLGSTP